MKGGSRDKEGGGGVKGGRRDEEGRGGEGESDCGRSCGKQDGDKAQGKGMHTCTRFVCGGEGRVR